MDDRRAKYKRPVVEDKFNFKIDVKFDITELDLMCAYIVSSNKSIRRGNIINRQNVFKVMDMTAYGNDQNLLNRIEFIKRGIDARLNKNLIDGNMILREITGGIGSGNTQAFKELNNTEIDWVNNNISYIIKNAHIQAEADQGIDILTRLKSNNYASRAAVVKEFEAWVTRVQNKFRKAKVDTADDMRFTLIGDAFVECMLETYRQIMDPGNTLTFGTQALNILTGGGLQAGRVYIILGLPGEGKSSSLLDMAIQIKKYNSNYKCKDPTKRPCVVLLVMENGIKETVQRLFSMTVLKGMENYTEDEFINEFRTKGLKISDDDPIDLIIKFKPNLSEDTSYMYSLCDDLEDEGYEVIAFFQDYLKRIRSVDGTFGGDLRLQYGAVVNEMKVFATIKNIPVFSASQLNRIATTNIDNARIKNKSDLVRTLGRSNVGESNLILENADWIGLIAPEEDRLTGTKYLGWLRVKSRYYIPDTVYCAYLPYIKGTIKFVEDAFSPTPAHKITMIDDDGNMPNGMSRNSIGQPNEIKDFKSIDTVVFSTGSKEDNLFDSASGFVASQYYIFPQKTTTKKQMYHLIRK